MDNLPGGYAVLNDGAPESARPGILRQWSPPAGLVVVALLLAPLPWLGAALLGGGAWESSYRATPSLRRTTVPVDRSGAAAPGAELAAPGNVEVRGSGVFLQISDVHLDPWYNASMGPQCFCNVPADHSAADLCAQTATGNVFGQQGCDSPPALLEAMLQAAAARAPPGGYDFILVSGDYSRHNMERVASPDGPAAVREVISTVVRAVERHFPTTVVHHGFSHDAFVLGNNDFYTDYNVTMAEGVSDSNPWFSSLLPLFNRSLGAQPTAASVEALQLESGEARRTFSAGGYFMRRLSRGLWLLALNTVVYSPNHRWPGAPPADPFGQLAWLRQSLEALRRERGAGGKPAGKAVIVGHIPPVVDHYKFRGLWLEQYAAEYRHLVTQYADVVSAQLFSHMHCDTIRLLPSPWVRQPLFVTSAVSPVYDNNPSFRVWKYRGTQLLDYISYGARLRREGQQDALHFASLGAARRSFGLRSLSSAQWRSRVADRLPYDPLTWRRYLDRLWLRQAGARRAKALSSPDFRARAFCAMVNARESDFDACIGTRPRGNGLSGGKAQVRTPVDPSGGQPQTQVDARGPLQTPAEADSATGGPA